MEGMSCQRARQRASAPCERLTGQTGRCQARGPSRHLTPASFGRRTRTTTATTPIRTVLPHQSPCSRKTPGIRERHLGNSLWKTQTGQQIAMGPERMIVPGPSVLIREPGIQEATNPARSADQRPLTHREAALLASQPNQRARPPAWTVSHQQPHDKRKQTLKRGRRRAMRRADPLVAPTCSPCRRRAAARSR